MLSSLFSQLYFSIIIILDKNKHQQSKKTTTQQVCTTININTEIGENK